MRALWALEYFDKNLLEPVFVVPVDASLILGDFNLTDCQIAERKGYYGTLELAELLFDVDERLFESLLASL